LDKEEWAEILRTAADLGALRVRFTGGEPLLREDFEEIYLCARRLGLKVLLFTNARKIDFHLADLFSRIPLLEKIEVSVYGLHTKSYEAVSRSRGSYREFHQGVERLKSHGIPFIVNGTYLPATKNEICEFQSWASQIPWMKTSPAYSVFFDLRSRRDSENKNEVIRSLRPEPEEGIRIFARDEESYIRNIIHFCQRYIGPPGEHLFPCGAGLSGCVDAYGRLQPCLSLRHPDTGFDLKRGSMRRAFEEFFPQLRQIKSRNVEYLNRCARCFLHGLCSQCPAKSWSEHGTLDTPVEYLCDVAHIQACQIGLIKESEKGWEIMDWRLRISKLKEKEK
jgi:radical SAM protein with 4Fe4S-binding SPASM domain